MTDPASTKSRNFSKWFTMWKIADSRTCMLIKTIPKFTKCIFYRTTVFIMSLDNQNTSLRGKRFHDYKWHCLDISYVKKRTKDIHGIWNIDSFVALFGQFFSTWIFSDLTYFSKLSFFGDCAFDRIRATV